MLLFLWSILNINMWAKQKGFTIVELLIVIVIIGILAAITIVAYNGIQDRARVSAVNSALSQATKKIMVWRVSNSEQYPSLLSDAGVNDTDNVSFQYTSDNSVSPGTYCLTATYNTITYYTSSSNSSPQQGVCSGYNLLAWNKTKAGVTPPIPSAVVDTSTYRTSTSSMRIGPNSTGQSLRGNPYAGTVGQIYAVTFWVRSDPDWNGTSGNSKIRFGNASNGALLTACGYGGVKATWTQASCSFTMVAGVPEVSITVGNDGTIGNIWIDDVTLTRSP